MRISTPDFFQSRWFLILSLVVLTYAFFVLGKMVWRNYQVNQQIKSLESEVTQIEQENQRLSDLISFFQTDTYKQQEAREKLGLVMPGEKVLVFPDSEKNNSQSIISPVVSDSGEDENKPNYLKWWDYFFEEK